MGADPKNGAPLSRGLITPPSPPRSLSVATRPAAIRVFPTSVSVPVIKIPSGIKRAPLNPVCLRPYLRCSLRSYFRCDLLSYLRYDIRACLLSDLRSYFRCDLLSYLRYDIRACLLSDLRSYFRCARSIPA